MGDIIKVGFNRDQQKELTINKGYKYSNYIVDSEIHLFIEKNKYMAFQSFYLYSNINSTWNKMNSEVLEIVETHDGSSNKYINSLIKQKLDSYKGEIQNILDKSIKKR